MVDDGQAVAERVGFIHVMGGEHDGFAGAVVVADDLPEQQARLRIEAGGGLVEEQHFGIVHHGAGDGEPLHHAAGEVAHHVVGAVDELEFFFEASIKPWMQ